MEVLVRHLDELEDLILVFFERLTWRTPKIRARYPTLLACLLYANPTQSIPITWTGAELFANPNVSFPTVTLTLSEDSLVIGPGSTAREKLLAVSSLGSGACPADCA